MGEVFLADDTQLGRKVAIKFLAEALEADEIAGQRCRTGGGEHANHPPGGDEVTQRVSAT